MSKIIVIDETYKNVDVNYKVLNYIINKRFAQGYMSRGIPVSNDMDKDDIMESAMFMQIPQTLYGLTENDKKVVHIILAFDNLIRATYCENVLMALSLDYFYAQGFQCAAAFHYRTEKEERNEHLHLIVNKISLDLKKFNESNQTYYDFANYLSGITHTYWGVIRKTGEDESELFSTVFIN